MTSIMAEAGFLLAGTVLPLALVYRWGGCFPGWVPLLAGRGVPRWLVLGPALGLGAGMTAYFGVTMVWLAVRDGDRHLGAGRRVVPVVVFLGCRARVPGLGLGAAALAYRRATPSRLPDLRPLTAGPPLPLRGPRAGVGMRRPADEQMHRRGEELEDLARGRMPGRLPFLIVPEPLAAMVHGCGVSYSRSRNTYQVVLFDLSRPGNHLGHVGGCVDVAARKDVGRS